MGKRKYPIPAVGHKFNDWTVIDNTLKKTKHKANGISVRCKCGYESIVVTSQLYLGKSKRCVNCRNVNISEKRYGGYEDLSMSLYNQIKFNASQRNIEFEVDIKYLWDLYQVQKGKCAISGVDLELSKQYANRIRKTKHYETASLDRIDSTKGYVKGNVHWIDKEINYMKRSMSMEKFIKVCKIITQYNENKNNN